MTANFAVSRDGTSFEEVRMSAQPTVPAHTDDGLQPIGDYYGVAYGSGGFVAVWASDESPTEPGP